MDVKSGKLRRLDAGDSPTWSPSGGRIAYESEGGVGGLFSIKPNGSGRMLIAPFWPLMPAFPQWSPDARSILFKSIDNSQLYVVAASGGKVRRVTARATQFTEGLWSPDARQIAFDAGSLFGASQIAIVGRNGKACAF